MNFDTRTPRLIGFKVARRQSNGSFRPCTSNALLRIRYRLGRTTHQHAQKYGPFAVFDTLDHARAFAHYGDTILRVLYAPSTEIYLWHREKFPNGEDEPLDDYLDMPLYLCPPGTILAKAVRPVAIETLIPSPYDSTRTEA